MLVVIALLLTLELICMPLVAEQAQIHVAKKQYGFVNIIADLPGTDWELIKMGYPRAMTCKISNGNQFCCSFRCTSKFTSARFSLKRVHDGAAERRIIELTRTADNCLRIEQQWLEDDKPQTASETVKLYVIAAS